MPSTIHIWDERYPERRFIKTIENVPDGLMAREVMMKYGIRSHLWVYEVGDDGEKSIINHGRSYGD